MGNSVVIPHIFGTIALLSMFFTIGTYYNGFFVQLNREAYEAQLGQVSEYISSNLIDLVVLSRLSDGDAFLVKTVEVPSEIGNRFYRICLKEMKSLHGEDTLNVVSELESLGVYSTADLPWPKNSYIEIYSNQSISTKYGERINLSYNITSNMAKTCESEFLIVWCSKVDNSITLGLGVLDRSEEGV
jgi:hypothetical protein